MHKKETKGDGIALIPKLYFGGETPFTPIKAGGLESYGITKAPIQSPIGSGYISQQAGNILGSYGASRNPGIMKDQKTGDVFNRTIGAGLQAALTGFTGIQQLNNTSMTNDQKRIATGDLSVDIASQAASAFGPVGSAIGAGLGLINKIGGKLMGTPKALKDFKINDTIAGSSSFTGIAQNATDAKNSANTYKNAGLMGKLFGGKNKLLNTVSASNGQQMMAAGIINENNMIKDRATASTGMFNMNNINKVYGNNMWNTGAVQYGKEGMAITKTYESYSKLLGASTKIDLKKIKGIKAKAIESTVTKFAEGGVIEPKNVIVEGKLHAHKHDLKSTELLADADITLKGVPVVTEAEGGVIVQHAEVEKDELILHYDLSKKLEDLYEEGTEEAMIQAGRILAKELIKNTVDSKSKIIKNA